MFENVEKAAQKVNSTTMPQLYMSVFFVSVPLYVVPLEDFRSHVVCCVNFLTVKRSSVGQNSHPDGRHGLRAYYYGDDDRDDDNDKDDDDDDDDSQFWPSSWYAMGIILLRAYYYPAESQIESPPDIQHADGLNATNRHSKTKTLNYIHSHTKTCIQAS